MRKKKSARASENAEQMELETPPTARGHDTRPREAHDTGPDSFPGYCSNLHIPLRNLLRRHWVLKCRHCPHGAARRHGRRSWSARLPRSKLPRSRQAVAAAHRRRRGAVHRTPHDTRVVPGVEHGVGGQYCFAAAAEREGRGVAARGLLSRRRTAVQGVARARA